MIIYKDREHFNYNKIIRYYKPNSLSKSNNERYYAYYRNGGYIQYITRQEALVKTYATQAELERLIELEKKLNKPSLFLEERKTNLKEFNLLKDKVQKKSDSTGVWGKTGSIHFEGSNGGLLSVKDFAEIKKEMRNLSDSQIQWDSVLSFNAEFAYENNIVTPRDLYVVFEKNINVYLKQNGFDPSKVNWFFAFHGNTDNPHVHYMIYETEPSFISAKGECCFKQNGELKLQSIIKFAFDTAIMAQIDKISLKEQENAKKEINYKFGNELKKSQKNSARLLGSQQLEKLFLAREKQRLRIEEKLVKNTFSLAKISELEKQKKVLAEQLQAKICLIDKHIIDVYTLDDIFYFFDETKQKEEVKNFLINNKEIFDKNLLKEMKKTLKSHPNELSKFSKHELTLFKNYFNNLENTIDAIKNNKEGNIFQLEKLILKREKINIEINKSKELVQDNKERKESDFLAKQFAQLEKIDKQISFNFTKDDLESFLKNSENKIDKNILEENIKDFLKNNELNFNGDKNFKFIENILANCKGAEELKVLSKKYNKTELKNFEIYINEQKEILNKIFPDRDKQVQRNTISGWNEFKNILKDKKEINDSNEIWKEINEWKNKNNFLGKIVMWRSLDNIFIKKSVIEMIDKVLNNDSELSKEIKEMKANLEYVSEVQAKTYEKYLKSEELTSDNAEYEAFKEGVLPNNEFIVAITEEQLIKGEFLANEYNKNLFLNNLLFGDNSIYEKMANNLFARSNEETKIDKAINQNTKSKKISFARFLLGFDRVSFQKELDLSLRIFKKNIKSYELQIKLKDKRGLNYGQ